MLQNYFITAYRNLKRQPVYTIINLSGLTIGISSFLFIFLFIKNELNYDSFHEDGERIYRIIRSSSLNNDGYDIGVTSGPFAPALVDDFNNDIEEGCRVMLSEELITSTTEKQIENIAIADSNFFTFFSFPLKLGNSSTVFENPTSVVISKKTANYYFANNDPIGQVLQLDNSIEFVVTGILDELPGNSHINFDMVFCITPFTNDDWISRWWNNNLYTYIKTKPGKNITKIESRFPQFMEKYFGKDREKNISVMGLKAEPLPQVYFNNETRYDDVKHGNKSYIYIFSAIGIFILLIACINFMNLSTAKSSKRAKEVGIRKTMGAYRSQLIFQFIGEAFLLTLAAILIACTFVEVALPHFNNILNLSLPETLVGEGIFIPITIILFAVSIVSGSYPAFMLSSFRPAKVIKGNLKSDFQHVFLRKFLVVLQFSVSVFLLIATLFIGKQMYFLNQKDLGFDYDQVLIVNFNNQNIRDNREIFKERSLQIPLVKSATTLIGEPGGFHDATVVNFIGMDKSIQCRTNFTDYQYLETFDIQLIAGRSFSQEAENNHKNQALVNETTCKKLGWTPDEIIGRNVTTFMTDSTVWEIVGVIKDYHFLSLKQVIEPLIIGNSKDIYQSRAAFKLKAGNHQQTINSIEKLWKEFSLNYPMEYSFLDDKLSNQYTDEIKQQRIFILFASVSIFIACLGIFGLASFTASLRLKEIGIRKVLGATTNGISVLLTKDFIILVSVAACIACPIGWWFMNSWLQGFAYRTDLSLWVFISAIGITLIIATSTVFFQTLKSAWISPVEALKSE